MILKKFYAQTQGHNSICQVKMCIYKTTKNNLSNASLKEVYVICHTLSLDSFSFP